MSVRVLCAPLIALLLLGRTEPARAQMPGGTIPDADASVAPSGTFRLRAVQSWTRYDALYGLSSDGRTRPLGALFSNDSLGVRQVPALRPIQDELQALTGSSGTRLDLGELVTHANSRVATTTLELQYGLTSRIGLSVMLPLVMARSTVLAGLNTRCTGVKCPPVGAMANMGENPRSYAATQSVVGQLTSAAAALQTALASCQANPGGSGCSNLLAHQSDAQALIASSTTFATNLTKLYGTDANTNPGQAFVPLTQSTITNVLATRVGGFNMEYNALLPGGGVAIPATFGGAAGPAARNAMQALVSQYGIDSIATINQSWTGDMELGVAYRLFDAFEDTARAHAGGVRARADVQGIVRLGTGRPPNASYPFDPGTGQGQTDLEGRAALDVIGGRHVAATVSGLYSYQLTSAHLTRAYMPGGGIFPLEAPMAADWKPGNVWQVQATPRLLITRYFQLMGEYFIRHVTNDLVTPTLTPGDTTQTALPAPWVSNWASTEQRVGLGFSYSAVDSYLRGRSPLPLEISWVHLETIHASGGVVPKYFQDQIGFRLYYQVLGKR